MFGSSSLLLLYILSSFLPAIATPSGSAVGFGDVRAASMGCTAPDLRKEEMEQGQRGNVDYWNLPETDANPQLLPLLRTALLFL